MKIVTIIAEILIPIALLCNTILISQLDKRISNVEEWVAFLLAKDSEYRAFCKYKESDG